jgi:hypothetical protein
MQQFDLAAVGLAGMVNIEGTATVLRFSPNKPIVFLIDEWHDMPLVIEQNIENGDQIRAAVPIGLVGVESHEANQPALPAYCINQHPEFALHFDAADSVSLVLSTRRCLRTWRLT